MAEFHSAALVYGSWFSACWLTIKLPCFTRTLENTTAIVNVISNSCAFPVITSHSIYCGNAPSDNIYLVAHHFSEIYHRF